MMERGAQVALRQPREVPNELDGQGFVETHRRPDGGDVVRGRP